jgi:hypothetical protein
LIQREHYINLTLKQQINNLLEIFLSKLISSISEEKNENEASRLDDCFILNELTNTQKLIENDLSKMK